jgi:hypothetical protein
MDLWYVQQLVLCWCFISLQLPWPADDGCVLLFQLKIAQLREGLGSVTKHTSEYRALLLGLRYAAKKGFKYIRAQGDAELICKQVCGYSFATLHFAAFVFFHGTVTR